MKCRKSGWHESIQYIVKGIVILDGLRFSLIIIRLNSQFPHIKRSKVLVSIRLANIGDDFMRNRIAAISNASRIGILSVLSLGLVLSTTSTASFADTFKQNHPRRAEVLKRDSNLNK